MSRTSPNRRLAITLLLLGNLAVGALIGLEVYRPDLFVKRMATHTAAAPGPETPAASNPAIGSKQPAPEDIAVVVERPLFSPTRRPPEVETKAAVANGPADLSGLLLVGVFGSENEYSAIITTIRPRAETIYVRAGDKVEGWIVESIEADKVIFVQGELRHEMELTVRQQKTRTTPQRSPTQRMAPKK